MTVYKVGPIWGAIFSMRSHIQQPIQSPIDAEWYKSHRRIEPDLVEKQYLRCWGEFSIGYENSFEKHLKQMRREG
jgi:hypothetical protein